MLTAVSLHAVVTARQQVQTRVTALDAASATRQALSGSRVASRRSQNACCRGSPCSSSTASPVALHDAERGELMPCSNCRWRSLPRRRYPVVKGLAGYVVRHRQPVLIDRWETAAEELRRQRRLVPDERPGSILMVPIRGPGGAGRGEHPACRSECLFDTDKNALLAIAEDLAPVIADALTFQELDEYRGRLGGAGGGAHRRIGAGGGRTRASACRTAQQGSTA